MSSPQVATSSSAASGFADGSSHDSNLNQFYTPLDPKRKEIRVLRIDNDPSQPLVHCHLEVVSLEDYDPDFQGLREVFKTSDSGDPSSSFKKTIELNAAWVRDFSDTQCSGRYHGDCQHMTVPRWRSLSFVNEWWNMMTGFEFLNGVQSVPADEESGPGDSPLCSRPNRIEKYLCTKPRFIWGDFEALSYCWESEVRDRPLVLNGKRIEVPRNLEAALQEVRHLPEVRFGMRIWCDALCINQDIHATEKSHQVGLMKEIYRDAFAVIAWLGPESTESDSTFDNMVRSYKSWITESSSEPFWPWLSRRLPWWDIQCLFTRSYWQRLWIIQELMLNQHMTLFLCGRHQAPRDVMGAIANHGLRRSWSIDNASVALPLSQATVRSPQAEEFAIFHHASCLTRPESHHASNFMQLGSKAKCKDPKDKIYGLLGLLPHNLSHAIVPDYQKDIGDLYLEFAHRFGSAMGLTSLLSWKSTDIHAELGLPSWVPDWTGIFPRKHVQWLMKRTAAKTTKGPNFDVSSGDVSKMRQLHCKAIVVDKVGSCSMSLSECPPRATATEDSPILEHTADVDTTDRGWSGSEPDLQILLALQRVLLMDHPGSYSDSIPAEDAHIGKVAWVKQSWMTIITDRQDHVMRSPHWPCFDQFRESNADFIVRGRPLHEYFNRNDGPHYFDEQTVARNMRYVVVSLNGRRRATTSEGDLLCLIPETARRGDIIAVLHGCNFPVVLRPAQPQLGTKSPYYEYIGECYVDGIMDGEAVDGTMKDVAEQDIWLV